MATASVLSNGEVNPTGEMKGNATCFNPHWLGSQKRYALRCCVAVARQLQRRFCLVAAGTCVSLLPWRFHVTVERDVQNELYAPVRCTSFALLVKRSRYEDGAIIYFMTYVISQVIFVLSFSDSHFFLSGELHASEYLLYPYWTA